MSFFRQPRPYGSLEAFQLHAAYPSIDLHADTLLWSRFGYDMGRRHEAPLPGAAFLGHVDLPRLRDAGASAQFFGLTAPPMLIGGYSSAIKQIDALDAHCRAYPERIALARHAADVPKSGVVGPLAAFLAVEGAHILEGDLANLERLVKRGLRVMGFAHFSANCACCPAIGIGRDGSRGLTRFGQRLLERCEQLGVIVDLAHINRRGFMDACAAAKKPVIVSHTGVSGAHRHPRNIDDGQLRAVADTGGVVGIIFAPVFLGGRGIDAVVRHLHHAVNIAGEEHVALGSDFDGMIIPTVGLKDVAMLPNLTDELLRQRWPLDRIGRVLRENALRVLRDVLPAL